MKLFHVFTHASAFFVTPPRRCLVTHEGHLCNRGVDSNGLHLIMRAKQRDQGRRYTKGVVRVSPERRACTAWRNTSPISSMTKYVVMLEMFYGLPYRPSRSTKPTEKMPRRNTWTS